MTEKAIATGKCLCGKVSYEITGTLGVFQYCHCSRCRKVSGSAHAANIFVTPDQFRWLSGENNLGRYEPEDAKHFATSFCKSCGSTMPWLAQSGKAVIVTAGTLDDDPGIRPMQNVFWGSKSGWYEEVSELPKHDELPPRNK